MYKICKNCNEEKPTSEFRRCAGGVLGLTGTCKKCKKSNNGFTPSDVSSLPDEIWIDLVGWKGVYEISNFSRIKRVARRFIDTTGRHQNLKEKILSPVVCSTTGYEMMDLNCVGRKEERTTVHRLVGRSFIPNPENKPEINHKNGIRNDNRIENLEWATSSEQKIHSFKVLGRKQTRHNLGKRGKELKHSKPVRQICLATGTPIKDFDCIIDTVRQGAATDTGCVIKTCKGKQKQHNGFKWEYL